MVRTHSPETLEGALSQLIDCSRNFERRFKDDKTKYLETFVYAGHRIAKHEDLPHILMGEFIGNYLNLYDQGYEERREFMEEWGYGVGVPRLKTEKDYTNWVVKLEEAALCGLAGGVPAALLAPIIGSLAAAAFCVFPVVFGMSYLFDTCKEKLAEHYNKRVTGTPGYEQMIRFQERVDQLIKDTVHEDTFA